MNSSLDEIKTTLAGLPLGERAELVHYLLHTLESPEAEVADDWLAISSQRMDDVRAGLVVGIPADEVLQSRRRPPE